MGEIIIKVPGDIKEVIEWEAIGEKNNLLENITKILRKIEISKKAMKFVGVVEDNRSYKEIKKDFYKNGY